LSVRSAIEPEEIDEILEHVERHLGPLSSGVQPPEGLQGVQVLVFRDVPGLTDVEVYLTLGFSRHPELRQEFLVASYEREKPPWAGILFDLVDERRRKNAFFERGEAVGPRGPVVGGATAQGFIAFAPLFLPDAFATLRLHSGVDVRFVWLVPSTGRELAFVRANGVDRWVDAMDAVADEVDLFDVFRADIPLPS